jgi:hypothetical protein
MLLLSMQGPNHRCKIGNAIALAGRTATNEEGSIRKSVFVMREHISNDVLQRGLQLNELPLASPRLPNGGDVTDRQTDQP